MLHRARYGILCALLLATPQLSFAAPPKAAVVVVAQVTSATPLPAEEEADQRRWRVELKLSQIVQGVPAAKIGDALTVHVHSVVKSFGDDASEVVGKTYRIAYHGDFAQDYCGEIGVKRQPEAQPAAPAVMLAAGSDRTAAVPFLKYLQAFSVLPVLSIAAEKQLVEPGNYCGVAVVVHDKTVQVHDCTFTCTPKEGLSKLEMKAPELTLNMHRKNARVCHITTESTGKGSEIRLSFDMDLPALAAPLQDDPKGKEHWKSDTHSIRVWKNGFLVQSVAKPTDELVSMSFWRCEEDAAHITPAEIKEMILSFLDSKTARDRSWILASRKIVEKSETEKNEATGIYICGPWNVTPADRAVMIQADAWQLNGNYEKQNGKFVITNVRILHIRR